MNIHYTHTNPALCAQALDNARLASALKENVQMLCTSAINHYHVPASEVAWRPTHSAHPCTQWLGESPANCGWLLQYSVELEKQRRLAGHKPMQAVIALMAHTGQQIHAAYSLRRQADPSLPRMDGHQQPTAHPNCARRSDMGIDFTHVTPTTLAYRQYLARRWEHQVFSIGVTWRGDMPPQWLFDPLVAQQCPTLVQVFLAETATRGKQA